MSKKYVSEQELAAIAGLSVSYFQKDRWLHKGKAPGIPFYKFGKSVRYDLSEVMSILESKRISVAV